METTRRGLFGIIAGAVAALAYPVRDAYAGHVYTDEYAWDLGPYRRPMPWVTAHHRKRRLAYRRKIGLHDGLYRAGLEAWKNAPYVQLGPADAADAKDAFDAMFR